MAQSHSREYIVAELFEVSGSVELLRDQIFAANKADVLLLRKVDAKKLNDCVSFLNELFNQYSKFLS